MLKVATPAKTSPPEHVGIIMDGNGRWANLRGRIRIFGHIKGARTAKKLITHCREKNLKYLTLYAFSSENWLRPEQEVGLIMSLLKRYVRKETATLKKQGIRFNIIGDKSKLPADVLKAVEYCISETKDCKEMVLTFAISYGSRQEILHSVKEIATAVQNHQLKIEDIDQQTVAQHLYTAGIPDPDLIIRTSGEKRISNFLLWQLAYSEFYFTDILWPEFTPYQFDEAIASYEKRDRRFGALTKNENTAH